MKDWRGHRWWIGVGHDFLSLCSPENAFYRKKGRAADAAPLLTWQIFHPKSTFSEKCESLSLGHQSYCQQ
jgi:hypothetical protein